MKIVVDRLSCTYPGADNGGALLWVNLHIRVEAEAGDTDTQNQNTSSSKNSNHWVGSLILKPVLAEAAVLVCVQECGGHL